MPDINQVHREQEQAASSAEKQAGLQSLRFLTYPVITSASSVVGKKEGEGPLGGFYDLVEQDPMFGGTSWEDAESRLMKQAVETALQKGKLAKDDIRFLIGGDLLGQLIATSFGIESFSIPLLGVYGACSTMGEAMLVAAMLADAGFARHLLAVTSSHFAGAEKQFRFPLGYGNQRPQAACWTVTGSGAVVVSSGSFTSNSGGSRVPKRNDKKLSQAAKVAKALESTAAQHVHIAGATIGKIVDYGLKDSMNMGACMAPAAADTIVRNLLDFERQPEDYDCIITGDLGYVGKEILIDLVSQKGFDISGNHMDCGIEIYDQTTQDTHSGGSGCGCSAVTLSAFILRQMREGKWNRVLFVPTGALLSTVSYNEGQSVPGIAHAVVLESCSIVHDALEPGSRKAGTIAPEEKELIESAVDLKGEDIDKEALLHA